METTHKPFFISQQALIVNEKGEMLILRNEAGWMLPGGRMEPKDTTWLEGLSREVREETGLEISEIGRILAVDISPSGLTYSIVFESRVTDLTRVRLSPEHQEYAWVEARKLTEYPFVYSGLPKKLQSVLQ